MRITMIAALDRARAIGRGNAMPWHLPDDFRHFKSLTVGKPVIMGRRTATSIGRALPDRPNIVLSRSHMPPFEGQIPARSLDEAVAVASRLAANAVGRGEHPEAPGNRGHLDATGLGEHRDATGRGEHADTAGRGEHRDATGSDGVGRDTAVFVPRLVAAGLDRMAAPGAARVAQPSMTTADLAASREARPEPPRASDMDVGPEIIIAGGGEIYALAMPLATDMRLTFVDGLIESPDAFFPEWDPAEWREASREHRDADERHAYAFDWVWLVR
jgi:dihydrofolate reductase